jgi:hypothetical protein
MFSSSTPSSSSQDLRRRWRAVALCVAAALATGGCTSILGDFAVTKEAGTSPAPDGGKPSDAATDPVVKPPPASCVANAKLCQQRDLFACVDGTYKKETTCPFVCADAPGTTPPYAECTGECTPNEQICVTTNATIKSRTCSPKGAWVDTVCTFVCHDKDSDAGPAGCGGTCKPSATSCNGSTLRTCDGDGSWKDTVECPFVCVPPQGMTPAACGGICRPTMRQCNGSQPQVCTADGAWVDDRNPCPLICSGGECTGICNPSQPQCKGRTVQNCVGGNMLVDAQMCPFACVNGACVGMCVPGSTRCNGSALETCGPDGTYSGLQPCPYVCSPTSGTCTGVCSPGSLRCNGKEYQTCNANGAWVLNRTCINICDVRLAPDPCTGDCSPGDKRCMGNVSQSCDATGKWSSAGTCVNGCVPDAGVCAGGG